MSYPINYPTPQGANVQIFSRPNSQSDWVKPQGASFVWFTVISGGGQGDPNTNLAGGGSSAVTNCLVPAFLIPDVLRISVATGGGSPGNQTSTVVYQAKDGTGYTLLTANPGNGTSGGAASTSNFFSAAGFFQSVAGQNGTGGTLGSSATTFLGGGGGDNNSGAGNYGYQIANPGAGGSNGYFQLQPIIVGLGGSGTSDSIRAGVGCGGAYGSSTGGVGGPGLVVIISW